VRPRPCTGYIYTVVYSVHGRVYGPCTRPPTAVYRLCTRPCTDHVHGLSVITAVYAVRTRPCTVNTAVFTARVHGIVRTVYSAVHGVYGSCTPACKGVYMVRPRPCTGYTYTVGYSVHGLVYVPCTRPLSAVYRLCTRPCTGHVRSPSVTRSRPCTRPYTAVYREHGRLYGPCARHCTYRQPSSCSVNQ